MKGTNSQAIRRWLIASIWTATTVGALCATAHATPETYTATHDTFVHYDSEWIPGNFSVLYTKHYGGDLKYVRFAVIRFDRTSAAAVDNAVLTLSVASQGDPEVSHQFRVWGLVDGAPCEAFDEATLQWDDCDMFADTIDASSASIYDGDPSTAGRQALGEFYVFDYSDEVRFSSDALTDFVADSSNDVLTLLIERTAGGGPLTHFAATEHATLPGPMLEVNVPPYAHLASVEGVDHNWTPSGLDGDGLANGIRFVQAVTQNGGDAGRARMDPDGDVVYQEADNGGHAIGDTIDAVALMSGIEARVPMEMGTFEMASFGASTVSLEPVADTFVIDGQGVQNAAWGQFGVTEKHAGLLRFERPVAETTRATLRLTVGVMDNDGEFYLWGLKDGGDAEVFDTATITYADLPFLDQTLATRTTEDVAYLHDADGVDTNGAQPLAVVSLTTSQAYTTITLDDPAIADFVNADADGNVSFLLTRGTGAGWSTFIANEHATLAPPTLELDVAAVDTHVIEFQNTYTTPVFFAEVATYNSGDAVAVYPISVGEDYAIVRMAEGSTYDNVHPVEQVHWAVMEAGYYDLQPHGHLEVGLAHTTTTSKDTFANVTPMGAYFDDSASLVAQPQYNLFGGYQGTRVVKHSANGSVTDFDVRFMLDRSVEDTSFPEVTGTIGWMVIGDGTPTTEPGEIPIWLLDGGTESAFAVQVDETEVEEDGCGGQPTKSAYLSASDHFGNDIAGAGYFFGAGVTDTLDDDLWVGIAGSVDGTLMGGNLDLLDIGAVATRNGGQNSSEVYVCLFGGSCLIEEPITLSASKSVSSTLMGASAMFFGVTVSGSLVGELGFEVGADPGASGLSVHATPYLVIDARASLSAGCCGLKISVRGNIEVFNASLPTTIDINVSGSSVDWQAGSWFEWSALTGAIKLKFKAFFWSKKKTIASWDGVSGQTAILDTIQGCLSL